MEKMEKITLKGSELSKIIEMNKKMNFGPEEEITLTRDEDNKLSIIMLFKPIISDGTKKKMKVKLLQE
jgi:hypothetical protein